MPDGATKLVDFRKVKDSVSIIQLLDRYGVELRKEGSDSLVGCCPIHDGSNDRSFRVSIGKNAWKCFGRCDAGGNILDFVAAMEDVSVRDAAVTIADWFGIDDADYKRSGRANGRQKGESTGRSRRGDRPKGRRAATSSTREGVAEDDSDKSEETAEPEFKSNPPLPFELKNLDPEDESVIALGVMPDTLAEFGAGFCKSGMMKGRVAIPIRDGVGVLLGYAGRTTRERDERYKYPDKFHKEWELYNLNRGTTCLQYEDKGLIIVFDFFDVFHLFEAGIENVIALMDTTISERQAEKFKYLQIPDERVTVFVSESDADDAADVVARLTRFVHTRLIVVAECDTILELPVDQIAALLS